MFRRGGGFGLRTQSLPKEGKTVSRQTAAILNATAPAEQIKGEHSVRSVVSLLRRKVLEGVICVYDARAPPQFKGQG